MIAQSARREVAELEAPAGPQLAQLLAAALDRWARGVAVAGGAAAQRPHARVSSPARAGRRCSRPATRTRSSITFPTRAVAAAADLAGASAAGVVRRQVHDIPTITPRRGRAPAAQTTLRLRDDDDRGRAGRGGRGRRCTARTCARWRCICWCSSTSRSPAPQTLIADLTGARPSTGWISSVLPTVAGAAGRRREADQVADRAGARDPRRRDHQQHQRRPVVAARRLHRQADRATTCTPPAAGRR